MNKVTLGEVLANITERIDLEEKVYETNVGKVRVERVDEMRDIYRVSIPSIGTEVITNPEDYGDSGITLTIRFFGNSPGSNSEIEDIAKGIYDEQNPVL